MPDKNADQKPQPQNSPPKWKKIVLNRWLLIGVGALLIYALLGFFLAPRLVKHFVTGFGQDTLKRQTSIGEVRVNPFLFTLDARDFALTETDGRPLVGFGRLFVDFELSSLFRWAWTFADIRLERPSLYTEIEKDGRLNFAKLAESLPKPEGPPPKESPPPKEEDRRPPRLVIQHAEIVEGSFTFSDQSETTPAKETFTPLNLVFKDISTLPERKGPYTIQADLPGGGTVAWQGEVSLQPIFSQGELSMKGFKLATAWQFAQDKVRLKEPEGEINASTSYRFDYLEHTPLLILEKGNVELKGLKLILRGRTEPLIALETIGFSGVGFDLHKKLVTVPEIRLGQGKVTAAVSKSGVLDWQTLVVPQKTPKRAAPPPQEKEVDGQPWQLKAESMKIENVAVNYKDSSRAKPLAFAIGGFNLSLRAAAAVGSGEPEATIDSLRVKLNEVKMLSEGDDNPLVKLDTLSLDDGRIDVGARSIHIPQLNISGGESRLVRDKEGRLGLVNALAPASPGQETGPPSESQEQAKAEGQPWSFRLDSFTLNGFKALVEDQTFSSPLQYTLQDIRAAVNKISNDAKTPLEFDTEIKVAQGGNVKISGQAGPSGDHAEAKVEISGFNLTPLQPAVAHFSTFDLKSGNVSATAKLNYEKKNADPQIRVDGTLRVDRFRLNEALTRERALEWRSLTLSGINFGLAPDRLRIRRVRLLEPGAKILISKDRRLNLVEAIKTPAPEEGEKSPPPAKGKKQAMFPVNIAAVQVEKGTVDFTDLSLILPFGTRVTDFKGGLTGISSASNSRSTVKFDGRVGEYGLATVDGSLSPFSPKDFTDIRVMFQNVQMPSFTPYSATFAGRKIASGVLNLDLGYKIENSQMLGDNKVVLERFTLGERVESPDAVSLPLDLAIALLSDSNGVIDVAVPVSGNLDDPKFSYGHVIWKAFFNLITKIVTSPFRALGGLFGGGEEQVDAIGFNPGSYLILPPEQQKLEKVVKALQKRPQLRLVVLGRFDPESDGLALRTERVKRALAIEMKQELPPEGEAGPVAFNEGKTQRSLEKLLEKQSGDKGLANFQAAYEKRTGKKADRVNPALVIFGADSPDTDFYQALFEELVRLEPLDEKPLQYLAQKRAEAIAEDLKTTFGLDEQRVAVGDTAAVEKPAKETIATRLQLDVLQAPPK